MSAEQMVGPAGEPDPASRNTNTLDNVVHLAEVFPDAIEQPIQTIPYAGKSRVGGATVKFTAERPVEGKDLKSNTAFVIAHGICGIEDAYEDLRGEIARSGYIAVTYKPPRGIGLRGYHPDHWFHPEKLLGQALYGAMKGGERVGAKQHVVLAHSLGGLTTKSLIDHHDTRISEMVESVILMDTVALHPHNWEETGVDFVKMIKEQIPPFIKNHMARGGIGRIARAAIAEAHYLGRDPTRVVREGLKAKNTSHEDMGETLQRARDMGIAIGYLGMRKSVVFSTDKAMEHSGHVFDDHRIGDWDHLGPMNDPEGTTSHVIELATGFAVRPRTRVNFGSTAG